jgi:hypothetical protein
MVQGAGIIRIDADRLVEVGDGSVIVALGAPDQAAPVVNDLRLRFLAGGPIAVGERFFILVIGIINAAAVAQRHRVVLGFAFIFQDAIAGRQTLGDRVFIDIGALFPFRALAKAGAAAISAANIRPQVGHHDVPKYDR